MVSFEKTKARIKARYQYDVGDSGALLITVIEEETARHQQAIDVAAARIHQSQQPFQTDNPAAAFWYGFGRMGIWVLPMILLLGIGVWLYSRQKNFEEVERILARYPMAREYENLIKTGLLNKGEDGSLNLMLRPAPKNGDTEAGKHYIYHEECKCVYVPLHW